MGVPADRRYTEEHEWAKPEGGVVRIGISDHAQHELGDVVFIELPEIGRQVTKGEALGSVESVKAVSDIYAPVSGIVKEVNSALNDAPQMLNESPYEQGWIVTLESVNESELGALLDSNAYDGLISEISK